MCDRDNCDQPTFLFVQASCDFGPIENSCLPWEELAVIPESYATAWTCLFRNLELKKDQTLVIRGATSSFGQAGLNMAVEAGAKVIATTRSRERFGKLEGLGAYRGSLRPSAAPSLQP